MSGDYISFNYPSIIDDEIKNIKCKNVQSINT